MRTEEISDKEVQEILNCPTCLPVIAAIREKRKKYGKTLYEAYDLVASKYYISFGVDIEEKKSKYFPYIKIDNHLENLGKFTSMTEAQKEILHQTMYELANRIENCEKSAYE